MAIVDFSTNKFSVYALLLGEEIEVTRIEAHFGLNSIPQAILSCAIGREVTTLDVAAIHLILDEIDINLPITVRCTAVELANSGVSGGSWPEGEFTLFEGRVVGLGFEKSRTGSAALTLTCRHFVMDLQYAATQTTESHPINPGQFGQGAGLKMVPGAKPDFVATTAALNFFTPANVADDMWGESFVPWLQAVIEAPIVFEGDSNFDPLTLGAGQGVDDALNALGMFEPNIDGFYTFGVPLAIDPAFPVVQLDAAIKAIGQDISKEQVMSFTGATIWEKLVQDYASRYQFAVVPMVSRMLVVPFTPGLIHTWVTIDPSEYDSISQSTSLSRALQAVVVYTGSQSMAGCFGFAQEAGAITRVGGIFENENIPVGQIVFRESPHWLASIAEPLAWAKGAVPINNKVIGNMAQPGVGNAPAIPNPKAVLAMGVNLWDAYAHALYLREVLSQRWVTIRSRFRLDIAPGSSIELLTTEEQFVAEQTGVGQQSLFGMVTKVSFIIDSEAVQAYTSFEIGYVLTELEFTDPALTTTKHPLYSTAFVGCELVEEDVVDPFPPVPEDNPNNQNGLGLAAGT